MNMSKEDEIIHELQRISKLLTVLATKEQSSQREKIATLSYVGFQPKEIAELLNTTANTVRVTLTSIRKEDKKDKIKDNKELRKKATDD